MNKKEKISYPKIIRRLEWTHELCYYINKMIFNMKKSKFQKILCKAKFKKACKMVEKINQNLTLK